MSPEPLIELATIIGGFGLLSLILAGANCLDWLFPSVSSEKAKKKKKRARMWGIIGSCLVIVSSAMATVGAVIHHS